MKKKIFDLIGKYLEKHISLQKKDSKLLIIYNKKEIFKNCARFTNCISEINNTLVDDDQDVDVVMPII